MSSSAGSNYILADGRWNGPHGIGRFATEIISRLTHTDVLQTGPNPLSFKNLIWQTNYLHQAKKNYRAYFNPGFNPILASAMPVTFTIHDLIHLQFPGKSGLAKKIYYHTLMKQAAKKAAIIFTVSHYSKQAILEWTKINDDKIVVLGNGVTHSFSPLGEKHTPGFPYLLHVGNTKEHKNVIRLIQAFARLQLDSAMRIIFTGAPSEEILRMIDNLNVSTRIIWSGILSESTLASYYRGATALAFPSLYEGFGLPVIEAMACGTPVLTSNVTSLPEVAGDAAILVDPYSTDAIANGLEKIISDTATRQILIERGLQHAKHFCWDNIASKVQGILATL